MPFLSYRVTQNQTVMLSRKWLDANISFCLTEADRMLSNNVCCLTLKYGWRPSRLSLFFAFSVAVQSGNNELIRIWQIHCVYTSWDTFVQHLSFPPEHDLVGKCPPCHLQELEIFMFCSFYWTEQSRHRLDLYLIFRNLKNNKKIKIISSW